MHVLSPTKEPYYPHVRTERGGSNFMTNQATFRHKSKGFQPFIRRAAEEEVGESNPHTAAELVNFLYIVIIYNAHYQFLYSIQRTII